MPRNYTLLNLAIMTENVAMVEVLIQLGAYINAKKISCDAHIFDACRAENQNILKLLLDSGANPNITSNDRILLADFCVCINLIDKLTILIEYGADINTIAGNGNSLLYNAIMFENTEVAKLLLNKGINTDIINKHNQTALSRAISYQNIEAFKLLLRSGVKPTVEDFKDSSPDQKLLFLLEFLLFKLEQNNDNFPLNQDTLDFVQKVLNVDAFLQNLQVDKISNIKTKALFILRRVGCVNKPEHINTIMETFGYDPLASKSLQEMCKNVIKKATKNENSLKRLHLPNELKNEWLYNDMRFLLDNLDSLALIRNLYLELDE